MFDLANELPPLCAPMFPHGSGPIARGPRVEYIPPRRERIGPRAPLPVVPARAAAVALRVIQIPPINPLADMTDDAITDLLEHLDIDEDRGDFILPREALEMMNDSELAARFGILEPYDLGGTVEPTAVHAIFVPQPCSPGDGHAHCIGAPR